MPPATLILTLGETPQVVTETVWALLRREPPFVLDRIWLATTNSGRRKLGAALAAEAPAPADGPARPYAWSESAPDGKLAELLDELAADGRLGKEQRARISVRLCAPIFDQSVVEDLRTSAESAAFGDMVLELVREATAEGQGLLHVSQAGGRKTMSFYAGQVITLLGRAGDELSHVLVEPQTLEGCPDFWWPTETDAWLDHRFAKGVDGQPLRVNARGAHAGGEARVDFHLVPFLLLGARTAKALRSGKLSFADAVAVQTAASGAGPLMVMAQTRSLIFAGRTISPIPHKEFALLAAWAEWSKAGRIAHQARKTGEGWTATPLEPGVLSASAVYAPVRDSPSQATILDVFLRWYADCRGEELNPESPPIDLATHIDLAQSDVTIERNISNNQDLLTSEVSRLRTRLNEAFPPEIASLLGVAGDPHRDPLFTVGVPAQDIVLVSYDERPPNPPGEQRA